MNICPYFHELDPILGERTSTRPQITTDEMDEYDIFGEDTSSSSDDEISIVEEMVVVDTNQSETQAAEQETREGTSTTSNTSTASKNPPRKVVCNNTKKKQRLSISPRTMPSRMSFLDDDDGIGAGGSWKQMIGQARIDEAKARAVAATAQADAATLEREKWLFEKQQYTASANMTSQLENMKKYTEMKNMGFSNEVIGEMVPELLPLINSIKRNS